jgi:alkyl hydroperoxide reductase subunit AhpF
VDTLQSSFDTHHSDGTRHSQDHKAFQVLLAGTNPPDLSARRYCERVGIGTNTLSPNAGERMREAVLCGFSGEQEGPREEEEEEELNDQ